MGGILDEDLAVREAAVTVDLVIFTIRQDELQLLLIERGRPTEGSWPCPGVLSGTARRWIRPRYGSCGKKLASTGAVFT